MTRRKFQNSVHDSVNSESFDYSKDGALMKKSVSKALYQNTLMTNFLNDLSDIFVNLIDNVKRIKKHFIYSVDIDDNNID